MGTKRRTATALFAITMLLSNAFSPQSLRADDEVLCAAILPCNSDGTVQPPYDQGACAAKYTELCTKYALQNLSEQVIACTQAKDDLSKQNDKLRRQLRAAKRRLG